jgi:CRISPR/Cas system CMR subunit Cmr6 (Cas7 group RAMP superfamily)
MQGGHHPPLRNQNPNAVDFMNLDRPMAFNELIDEKKLDEEYESIKAKIKELLKLTSPLTEFDEDE